MRRCNETNPEHPALVCIQPEGRHLDHLDAAGGMWPNTLVREAMARAPKKRRGGGRDRSKASADARAQITEMAARARHEARVNPLADGRRAASTGIPAEAVVAWSKEEWAKHAAEVFHSFLHTRTEPFTTPEHVWPLLDAPGEMRAMSLVVQALLRAGLIEEVGSKRLRDTYRTRDGVEFAMNKLVPIYRSLMVGQMLDVDSSESFDSKED